MSQFRPNPAYLSAQQLAVPNLLPTLPKLSVAWEEGDPKRVRLATFSSNFLIAVWRSVLPTLVLDPEHEEVEFWYKLPEFEATAIEVMREKEPGPDPHEAFVSSLNYGILLYGQGKWQLALHHFNSIQVKDGMVAWERSMMGVGSVWALEETLLLRWRGRANMKLGNYSLAKEAFTQVLGVFKSMKIDTEESLANSDLAWIYHDCANRTRGLDDKRGKLMIKSINYFTKAIELREKAPEHVGNRDSLRLLVDDYYGRAIMTVLFKDRLDEAERNMETAHQYAKLVYGDKENTDVMSRVKRGLGIIATKRAQCTTGDDDEQHRLFVKGIELLKEARKIRASVLGETHSQVANLYSLIAEAIKLRARYMKPWDPDIITMQTEAKRYSEMATKIWNENGLKEDHPWRVAPMELTAASDLVFDTVVKAF
ncbi:hypothetical protein BASA81_004739 [Batrachochytrium salamandrivorans]|nr:hypothetical protein BASA81_004739 [Batrachochytrium salamandrivorans]